MPIELALGLAVGVIMALTGAGGGILAVPLLIFGAHLQLSQAAPVALLAVGIAAALGAIMGLMKGIVRYKATLLMASLGMLLAPMGVWLSEQVDNDWLSLLFALILLFVAYRTFRQARDEQAGKPIAAREPPCVVGAETGRFVWTARCARVLGLSGAVAGVLAGLLGVGGGFVMVPALKRYTDLAMQSIIATSLAVIALVSVSGVASSVIAGSLDRNIALPFAAGSLGGMLLGRIVSSRIQGARLQQGFAAVSTLVAIGMIVKTL